MNFIKEMQEGNIFLIPLYLPAYQTWRDQEDIINYGKYQFEIDDNYMFGRVIEHYENGEDLIEVFRYFGKIPHAPTVITNSGRLFEPVHIGLAFLKKRYPFVFADFEYDKYKASDYKNISFLLMSELWQGGEKIEISQAEKRSWELKGVAWWIVYTGTQLEERIRMVLKNRGIELNYDQIIEQRKETFPVPKMTAIRLKKKLSPFLWDTNDNTAYFSLTIDDFRNDWFIEYGLLGNGYDWQKLFSNFVAEIDAHMLEKITYNSEAGTFSISSLDKKGLQSVALAFRSLCENKEEFKNVIGRVS